MILWTVDNNTSLGTLDEGITLRAARTGEARDPELLPIQISTVQGAEVVLISGELPPGMQLNNGEIFGTPLEVSRETEFKFVLRASLDGYIEDRTLAITVVGADAPQWITAEGLLPVGNNNTFFILDSSPVDFQLIAQDTDLAAGQTLEYFIASGDGELPPGVQLTASGKVQGVVDPVLALDKMAQRGYYDETPYSEYPFDFGVESANGYDSFFYDVELYDYSLPTASPKKLNRQYQFRVSVSDGDTVEKRLFRIYVVGDDFLRADNTIMDVDTTLFSADNTFVRIPIWLTPGDLGYRRADNYLTLYFDVIDTNTISGFVSYSLEDYNDDGSISTVPPGLKIDGSTGELAGRTPYQPSITREYKFTITATRYTGPDLRTPVTIRVWENTTSGANRTVVVDGISLDVTDIKIYKNPQSAELIGNSFAIKGTSYKIIHVDSSNLQYDLIRLSKPLVSFLKQDSEFTDTLLLDGNTLNIAEKTKTFTVKLLGKVDSVVTWLTDKNLGRVAASSTSLIQLEAVTSVPHAILRHRVVTGRLPPGLSLTLSGELIGRIQQFGEGYYKSIWKPARVYQVNDVVKHHNKKYQALIDHTSAVQFDTEKWAVYKFATSGLTSVDSGELILDNGITTLDREYQFEVSAADQFEFSASARTFTISIDEPFDVAFSNIVLRPMLSQQQREAYSTFISDSNIVDPSVIYRPNDVQFGLRYNVEMLAYAGLETVDIQHYVAAAGKNHRRKQLKFGNVKTAIARLPGTRETVYEVVYVEIIDPDDDAGNTRTKFLTKTQTPRLINDTLLETQDNTFDTSDLNSYRMRPTSESIRISSDAVTIDGSNQSIKYISNLTNMRSRLSELGITNDEYLPLWMRTPQPGNIESLGYVPAVILAYCIPGAGQQLLTNIARSGFEFNQLNFEVDRYVITGTKGNSNEQYVVFANYDFNV